MHGSGSQRCAIPKQTAPVSHVHVSLLCIVVRFAFCTIHIGDAYALPRLKHARLAAFLARRLSIASERGKGRGGNEGAVTAGISI